jgi:hypothetical protein
MASDVPEDPAPAREDMPDLDGLDTLLQGLSGVVTKPPGLLRYVSAPEPLSRPRLDDVQVSEEADTAKPKLNVANISESALDDDGGDCNSDEAVKLRLPTFSSGPRKSNAKKLGARKLPTPALTLDAVPFAAPDALASPAMKSAATAVTGASVKPGATQHEVDDDESDEKSRVASRVAAAYLNTEPVKPPGPVDVHAISGLIPAKTTLSNQLVGPPAPGLAPGLAEKYKHNKSLSSELFTQVSF